MRSRVFTSEWWQNRGHDLYVLFLLSGSILVLKGRDITLLTKVHVVKAMVFPVVICRCENWSIKKAEHQGIDAFELWWWRRLFKVPWTARRSKSQS